jgi:4-hydroxy-2-oxoheptanedioate aldolase
MFTSHAFQTADASYIQGADKNLLVIVQIESVQGVENVEEIAKVDGLDCLFIGALNTFSHKRQESVRLMNRPL